jgi:hypothetical protein
MDGDAIVLDLEAEVHLASVNAATKLRECIEVASLSTGALTYVGDVMFDAFEAGVSSACSVLAHELSIEITLKTDGDT